MTQVRITLFVAAVLASWNISAGAAQAADDPDALLRKGIDARKAGDHEAALRMFQRSYELSQSGKALAQMGFAEQALGRWVVAERHLNEALVLFASDPWIKKNANVLDAALNVIRDHVGSVEIVVAATDGSKPNADLTADDQSVDRSLWSATPLRVSQGTIALRVDAPGYESQTRTIAVTGQRTSREVFTLKPLASPPPPSNADRTDAAKAGTAKVQSGAETTRLADAGTGAEPRPIVKAVTTPEPVQPSSGGRRTVGAVTAGVGLAAVGAGVYFGLQVKSDSSDVTNASTFSKATEDSALRAQTLELVFLGAGVAAIAVGSLLYFWPHADGSDHQALLTPVIAPGFAGATLRLPLF